jgi:hypothetical protein
MQSQSQTQNQSQSQGSQSQSQSQGQRLFAPPVKRGLFSEYSEGEFYDEMFDESGVPRDHYLGVFDQLSAMTGRDFESRRKRADLTFLQQGITSRFTAATAAATPNAFFRSTWCRASSRRASGHDWKPDSSSAFTPLICFCTTFITTRKF